MLVDAGDEGVLVKIRVRVRRPIPLPTRWVPARAVLILLATLGLVVGGPGGTAFSITIS